MNNYKEKYTILVNNIDELKNKRQELEEILNEKKKENKKLLIKESELIAEIKELKEERNYIINKKTKPAIAITNTILILLLMVAAYLEITLVSEAATILKKILIGIGLFAGLGNLYAIAAMTILLLRNWIIGKIQNKNKKTERCIELTKEIKKKNKNLSDIEQRNNIITEEQKQLKNDISKITEQIELNTNELQKLKDEIVKLAIEESTEVYSESHQEKETKPYARVRIMENTTNDNK